MGRAARKHKIKERGDSEFSHELDEDDEGMLRANVEVLTEDEAEVKPLEVGVVRFTKKNPEPKTETKKETEPAEPSTSDKLNILAPMRPKTWEDFERIFDELYDNGYLVNTHQTGAIPEEAVSKSKETAGDCKFFQPVLLPDGKPIRRFSYADGKQGLWIAFHSPTMNRVGGKITDPISEPERPKKPSPPTPTPAKEEPKVDAERIITWARLKPDGSWGVRVPTGEAEEGDKVTVHRKDGTTSEHQLDVIVGEWKGYTFFSLRKDAVV